MIVFDRLPVMKIKYFVILIFFLAISLFLFYTIPLYNINSPINQAKIIINNQTFYATVVSNSIDQAMGLSGTKNMESNQAMLFEYKHHVIPNFWMKGMLFPIDIIWIKDNKIIAIEKNIPNPSQSISNADLPKYKPLLPVNFVLEINAGLSEKYDFTTGERVDIIKN